MGNINGKNYDWSDVSMHLPEKEIEIQDINYDDELDKELNYGKGRKPRGYGTGLYKASGKLTLLREDYQELLDYCKSKGVSFYDLEIEKIVVNYANDTYPVRTDVLPLVTFQKKSNKSSQGDKNIKVELDFLIAGVIDNDGVKSI
jgi:hypothetical protein